MCIQLENRLENRWFTTKDFRTKDLEPTRLHPNLDTAWTSKYTTRTRRGQDVVIFHQRLHRRVSQPQVETGTFAHQLDPYPPWNKHSFWENVPQRDEKCIYQEPAQDNGPNSWLSIVSSIQLRLSVVFSFQLTRMFSQTWLVTFLTVLRILAPLSATCPSAAPAKISYRSEYSPNLEHWICENTSISVCTWTSAGKSTNSCTVYGGTPPWANKQPISYKHLVLGFQLCYKN
jgi:hypothetical protein